ncbi:AAA family ATPase [Haliangium sp.]|uniref:AAA family ATPase n=1 Tax=Haliangium sp. TaxID=2663208 RepID=UPI003D0C007A
MSVALSAVVGTLLGALVGAIFGVVMALPQTGFFGWFFFPFFRAERHLGALSRQTLIPIPGLKKALVHRLEADWDDGVDSLNQLIAYSLQFYCAIKAINVALARSRPRSLLTRVSRLAQAPFDWQLLRYGTADIGNALRAQLVQGLVLVPRRWRAAWQARYPSSPRLDTPARSACAGFWSWHTKDATMAADAFRQVRDLPFGSELSDIADALEQGGTADTLDGLDDWHTRTAWLEALPTERLRPGTLTALTLLRRATAEVHKAQTTRAPLNRQTALARAGALLQELIEHGAETCEQPEWPLVHAMAEGWRDLVVTAGGKAGDEVERQRADNPYSGYAGLPVHPPVFIGRSGAIGEIRRHWANAEDPPVIVLYGHRRMGKTSILRNLAQSLPKGAVLVYLDAQGILADDSGQFLLDIAEAIHTRASHASLDPGPLPSSTDYDTLGHASRQLKKLLARLAPQMTESRRLILAFDEFEVIQDRINDGHIDAKVLGFLRSLNQAHRWLALIFGGLHTMDEMGNDYRSAFYAQTEHVRVSYLSRADAMHLVTQPHPDFALEYDDALCDELYRLTYGQPFLLQRLCWAMVERWNDRFERERGAIPRVLTLDDLAPILDDDLFAATAYYFEGVWSNVSPAEQMLMTVLAGHESPWHQDELEASQADLDGELTPTLRSLRHHDVITEDDEGRLMYASELLRRWVERRQAVHGQVPNLCPTE